MKSKKGWRNEPLRHSLASKGVKTGSKSKTPVFDSLTPFEKKVLLEEKRKSLEHLEDLQDFKDNYSIKRKKGLQFNYKEEAEYVIGKDKRWLTVEKEKKPSWWGQHEWKTLYRIVKK